MTFAGTRTRLRRAHVPIARWIPTRFPQLVHRRVLRDVARARWANWARYAGSELPLALIALVDIVLIITMFRPAIIVTGDHVIVRGWIRKRTESWSKIAGFVFAPANPLNRSVVYIEVLLADGSRVHTPGLTAASKQVCSAQSLTWKRCDRTETRSSACLTPLAAHLLFSTTERASLRLLIALRHGRARQGLV
jgi:Bacterial PH domain